MLKYSVAIVVAEEKEAANRNRATLATQAFCSARASDGDTTHSFSENCFPRDGDRGVWQGSAGLALAAAQSCPLRLHTT